MKITSFKSLDKNTLRAVFDLELSSGIMMHGVMLHEKTDTRWISFAGIPYEKDGKTNYRNVVSIPDRAVRDRFNAQVIAALVAAGHIQ